MKVKTTIALFLILGVSYGALAQKPLKFAGEIPRGGPVLNSTHDPAEQPRLHREKFSPFRLKKEIQDPLNVKNTGLRLKAEPAAVGFTEKLDSLEVLYYDTDSESFITDGMEYYFYDTKGRNYSYWNTSYDAEYQAIIPGDKMDLSYSGDNIASQTYSEWSVSSGEWVPYYRNSYVYDENGNPVAYSSYSYDTELQQFYLYSVDSTRYDGEGMILEEVTYYVEGDLYPESRNVYTYENGNLVLLVNYYYSGDPLNPWMESSETEYYLDQSGRDTSVVQRYWDGEVWYDSYKTLKSYDASGNLILYANYNWNGEILVWDPSWKDEYAYDADNRQTGTVYFSWDYNSEAWYIVEKYDYAYDANGNILEEAYSTYDTLTKIYTPDWKDVYQYDLSVDVNSIAMPYWYGMDFGEGEAGMQFNNKITDYNELTWNPNSLGFDTTEIDLIFYSGFYDSPIDDADCNADFSWRLDDNDDQLVYFTDKSDTAIVSLYWMFGDGATSARRNPEHQYALPGTYRVVLTTVDASGFCSNTVVKQIKVGDPACNAAFTILLDTAKLQVALTNQSVGSGIQYYWNFGDGSVDNAKDPVHAYQYPGTYKVSLTISSDQGACRDQYSATVRAAVNLCNADFAVYVDSVDNTGYFRAKQVIPGNQYHWMLGDGASGTTPNFIHTFSSAGYYSATLTVSNSLNCVESSREVLLIGKPSTAGKAAFIYLAGEDNKVEFTNQSIGSNLSYYWDFNDGQNSSDKNPTHPYSQAGYYTVCLTVFGADGSQDTHCEKIFTGTDTKDACEARFEYVLSDDKNWIYCMDRSFGDPDKFLWTYNDADSTDEKNPSWFSSPAYVRVRQTIMNTSTDCRDDAYALVNMGAEDRIKAGFAYQVDSSEKKAETYPVDFVGVSLGDAGKLKWSFGDGEYDSTSVNPTHVYTLPGVYQVCLTITNTSTGESDTECQNITVGWAQSVDKISRDEVGLKVYPNPFSENTRIDIVLDEASLIDLSVYDLRGRKVRTIASEKRTAGAHSFSLEASELESGTYYLILETGNGRAEQLISLIR